MRDINEDTGNQEEQHEGRDFYLAHGCISCHGANREGIGGLLTLKNLNTKYQQQDIVQVIKNGKGAMPAFSQIPEDEVQLLAAYLMDINTMSGNMAETKKETFFRSIGYKKFLDKEGYPATAPPRGTLNAIDLNTEKIKWKVPLGEYAELTQRGIPVTEMEKFGGSVTAAGGVIFIGATRDQKFRAFDKRHRKGIMGTSIALRRICHTMFLHVQ